MSNPEFVMPGHFEARPSDDEVKTDLELTCTTCGEVLCDIEPFDQLATLMSLAWDHVCGQS